MLEPTILDNNENLKVWTILSCALSEIGYVYVYSFSVSEVYGAV